MLLLWVCAVLFARAVGAQAQYWDNSIGDDILVWPQCETAEEQAKAASRIRIPLVSPYAVEQDMKAMFVELIDIRADYEFNRMHLAGARNIPYNHTLDASIRRGHPLVLYCGECCCDGIKSAAGALIRRGFKDVSVLRGGLQELGNLVLWQAADEEAPKQLVGVACGPARDAIEQLQDQIELEIAPPIHFEFNKAVLRSYSLKTLEMIAKVMKDYSHVKLKVFGHTCEIGSKKYNLKLSRSRAQAVRRYLVGRGVDHRRIRAEGFGDTRPIASNNTDEGRKMNRRVEFNWLEADAPMD
ncbi:MAG: OmpA family protein [Elusimicrobiota bacterium]